MILFQINDLLDEQGCRTVQPEVEAKAEEGATLHADESSAYNRVAASGRHGTQVPFAAGVCPRR
ncbi:MAG: hypothetical protein ACKN9T_08665 [Candidatus Methylumidiphilus sp.]